MDNFTKAFHIRDGYIFNGVGTRIPVRMTIISRLDGDEVKYKASFCPPTEKYGTNKEGKEYLLRKPKIKQFNKKMGVLYAKNAPEWSFPLSNVEEHTHINITNAIMEDMYRNHLEELPTNVQRWISGDNFGSNLHEIYEHKLLFDLVMNEALQYIESEEKSDSTNE